MIKDVLELGEKLVLEFGMDSDTDTLSRWMAHYIAELIDGIQKDENMESPELTERQKVCVDTILNLWSRRNQYPDDRRPLKDLDEIRAIFESLDPEANQHRYWDRVRQQARKSKEDTDVAEWLDFIDFVDSTAKVLIRWGLAEATSRAIDNSKEWVQFVNDLDESDTFDRWAVKFVKDEGEVLIGDTSSNEKTRLLEKRLERLRSFRKIAEDYERLLESNLEEAKKSI